MPSTITTIEEFSAMLASERDDNLMTALRKIAQKADPEKVRRIYQEFRTDKQLGWGGCW